ncbi:monocarboxylate permease [Aspergillus luchuensis]|uniref:Monocarboxylate permease n=1 Tax=Aspergillus kawachii TaxID=1069201 RepID=A0A146FBC1_ASPKA|nr:monocarboxylate permease [Aspergillus luchuensis]
MQEGTAEIGFRVNRASAPGRALVNVTAQPHLVFFSDLLPTAAPSEQMIFGFSVIH